MKTWTGLAVTETCDDIEHIGMLNGKQVEIYKHPCPGVSCIFARQPESVRKFTPSQELLDG